MFAIILLTTSQTANNKICKIAKRTVNIKGNDIKRFGFFVGLGLIVTDIRVHKEILTTLFMSC